MTFQGRALGPAGHTLGPGLSPQGPWWRAGVAGVPIKGAAVTPPGKAPGHQHRRESPETQTFPTRTQAARQGRGPSSLLHRSPAFRSLPCPPGRHCLLEQTPSSPQVSAAHVSPTDPGIPEHFLTASLITEREPSSHLHEGPWSQSRIPPAAPPAPGLDPGMGGCAVLRAGRGPSGGAGKHRLQRACPPPPLRTQALGPGLGPCACPGFLC